MRGYTLVEHPPGATFMLLSVAGCITGHPWACRMRDARTAPLPLIGARLRRYQISSLLPRAQHGGAARIGKAHDKHHKRRSKYKGKSHEKSNEEGVSKGGVVRDVLGLMIDDAQAVKSPRPS